MTNELKLKIATTEVSTQVAMFKTMINSLPKEITTPLLNQLDKTLLVISAKQKEATDTITPKLNGINLHISTLKSDITIIQNKYDSFVKEVKNLIDNWEKMSDRQRNSHYNDCSSGDEFVEDLKDLIINDK